MNAHMFSGLSDLVGVPTVVASLPNSALRDVTLVTLNWLQWEYLHHGNWKIVQIRIFFPLESLESGMIDHHATGRTYDYFVCIF